MKPLPMKGSKQQKPPLSKVNILFLATAMALAIAVSLWLALAPQFVKQQAQKQQTELLTSIRQGDGLIILPETLADTEVDFYDGGADAPELEAMAFMPPETITTPKSGEVALAEATASDTTITGIGVLSIDSIDLVIPVAEGVTNAQLKVAVGHVPQTATIGEIGGAVIAGHRSYTYGEYFNRLGEVKLGDIIQYQPKDGATIRFEVDEILKTLPGDQTAFTQPTDRAQITLYTCTPIRTATHRLLIRATRSTLTEEDTP